MEGDNEGRIMMKRSLNHEIKSVKNQRKACVVAIQTFCFYIDEAIYYIYLVEFEIIEGLKEGLMNILNY